MQFDDVLRVLAALASAKVEYVLVGGVAVGLHGFERATNDIDLFVRTDEDNIGRLRAALHSVYDDPSIDDISAADLAGSTPQFGTGLQAETTSLISWAGWDRKSDTTTWSSRSWSSKASRSDWQLRRRSTG